MAIATNLNLGRFINSERKKIKLSSRELSERCKMSKSYVDFIENGLRVPSINKLAELSKALEFDSDKSEILLNIYLSSLRERFYNELKLVKIYVAHSNSIDYRKILYEPLRDSELNNRFNIILPHEISNDTFSSKELLKNCKYMILDLTEPSSALIEAGWADSYGVEIICIYKSGTKVSKSLNEISEQFIEYEDSEDLIHKLEEYLLKERL